LKINWCPTNRRFSRQQKGLSTDGNDSQKLYLLRYP
jgi:hypothetical protein